MTSISSKQWQVVFKVFRELLSAFCLNVYKHLNKQVLATIIMHHTNIAGLKVFVGKRLAFDVC